MPTRWLHLTNVLEKITASLRPKLSEARTTRSVGDGIPTEDRLSFLKTCMQT
jgi:hypothetical protein